MYLGNRRSENDSADDISQGNYRFDGIQSGPLQNPENG